MIKVVFLVIISQSQMPGFTTSLQKVTVVGCNHTRGRILLMLYYGGDVLTEIHQQQRDN